MAAAARAAHRLVDSTPHLFVDEYAETLLGGEADQLLAFHRLHGEHPILAQARVLTTFRSRIADAIVTSSEAPQVVLLGAGLDAYAWRNPGKRVFEVDMPATQADKRARVVAAGLAETFCHFVPVDLETDPLLPALVAAGFDTATPAVVTWLGVSMYLTPASVASTLTALGELAPGSELVWEYALPDGLRDPQSRDYVTQTSAVADGASAQWRTALAPEDAERLLESAKFVAKAHHQPAELGAGFWTRHDALRSSDLLVVCHATRATA